MSFLGVPKKFSGNAKGISKKGFRGLNFKNYIFLISGAKHFIPFDFWVTKGSDCSFFAQMDGDIVSTFQMEDTKIKLHLNRIDFSSIFQLCFHSLSSQAASQNEVFKKHS